MKKFLVTGGTVFVSKFIANYFASSHEVYVLNRNTRSQLSGVHLIQADRHHLGDVLKSYTFDAVIDVCAYDAADINDLLDALNPVEDYIFISSSAVYPQTNPQPFREDQPVGPNAIWGAYGTGKIAAERTLLQRKPSAYILRPPYLYGPMQNIYREPFVFDCALADRPFYVPKDGQMKLQFFHVEDLCRVIDILLASHPQEHIYNVGNKEAVDIHAFVSLCYEAAGKQAELIHVFGEENQRNYFCFHDYAYMLDVTRQQALLPETKDLKTGLQESFDWYILHQEEVRKKDYFHFIDQHLGI